jgi:hypothetical protein
MQRDEIGMISSGIAFHGNHPLGKVLEMNNFPEDFAAVYLAEVCKNDSPGVYSAWLGNNWRDSLNIQTHQIAGHPGIFIGEEFLVNGVTLVEAVAGGREVATAILQFLRPKGQ